MPLLKVFSRRENFHVTKYSLQITEEFTFQFLTLFWYLQVCKKTYLYEIASILENIIYGRHFEIASNRKCIITRNYIKLILHKDTLERKTR